MLPPPPPGMVGAPMGKGGEWEQRIPLNDPTGPPKPPTPSMEPGGLGRRIKPPVTMAAMKHLSPRAMAQIFLTVLTVGSSLVAFVFSVIFNDQMTSDLMENNAGTLKSNVLPCIREVLPVCGNNVDDKCWDRCCPPGYVCARSPVVGLYCQDGNNICGGGDPSKLAWCTDYADIPGSCKSDVCIKRDLVHSLTVPTLTITGFGMFLDLIDIVIFFATPDAVAFKAGLNLTSSLFKWIAFGLLLSAGTAGFISDLYDMQCYNNTGMQAVREAGQYLVSFVVTIVISALLSLILAPLSAFYGGKLIGVPYVK